MKKKQISKLKPVIDVLSPEYKKQIAITESKFEKWDRICAEENPDPLEYYTLLKDPTIYSYAFFRNKDHKPLKMYPYQDLIINDPSKRIVFAAANQIGKSVSLCVKAVHFALHNPGKTVVMVSLTERQSKDLLREIDRLLQTGKLDHDADIGRSHNRTEISFKHYHTRENGERYQLNESRILCVPASTGGLGYAADLVLMDELGFYENGRYIYYQIFQPRTYETKGPIIVFSNPNGQQGIFWELWNDDQFQRYRFCFLDKPGNTEEEYENLRRKLTREEFDSTVNANFTSAEGGFFSLAERKLMQEDRPNFLPAVLASPIFIFFDFAKIKDRTVRVIGSMTGEGETRGVYVHEMMQYQQGTSYKEIVMELVDLIKSVGMTNVVGVGWDNTGIGKGIDDFISGIAEMGITCYPIEFSLQNKSRIYTQFKLLAERNVVGELGIKIPYDDECDKQLSKLRFKRSNRGYLQVHHENENDRDDYHDALAGLVSLVLNPDFVETSFELI